MSDEVQIIDSSEGDGPRSTISEPGKLLRIALMLRELQEEVRRADPDQAGREMLRGIHERALEQMKGVLTGELHEELTGLALPFTDGTPTESELRIAQAQLIGWLEGLFQGIQAAIFTQQREARAQLEQMRNRGLPSPGRQDGGSGTGQYL